MTRRLFLAIAFLFSLFGMSGTAFAGTDYRISWGDNLTKISERFGSSIERIMEANAGSPAIKTRDLILADFIITIPEKDADVVRAAPRESVVRLGDARDAEKPHVAASSDRATANVRHAKSGAPTRGTLREGRERIATSDARRTNAIARVAHFVTDAASASEDRLRPAKAKAVEGMPRPLLLSETSANGTTRVSEHGEAPDASLPPTRTIDVRALAASDPDAIMTFVAIKRQLEAEVPGRDTTTLAFLIWKRRMSGIPPPEPNSPIVADASPVDAGRREETSVAGLIPEIAD